MENIREYLAKNTYPGRGIALGMSPDGKNAVIAYFIMGRSVNSRNRVFVADGEGLRTEAYDISLLADPSLIIYAPVRVLGKNTIVTNGDQTDTIYDYLAAGKSFADGLRSRCFEPDAPNFTPRISGIVCCENGGFSYKLSILKHGANEDDCRRYFYEYSTPIPGLGHIIHTYATDGNPLPSFNGEPIAFAIDNDIDCFASAVWSGLNVNNKVSLFVRYINTADGTFEDRILNKNGGK